MASRIPVRPPTARAMTRPTAKKIENLAAISRNTTTNSKSNATSAISTSESRVTAATASSKAKSVSHTNSAAAAVPGKRKREILAEVTDVNRAGASKAKTIAKPQTRRVLQSTTTTSTTTTTTTARVGVKKPVRVPPCRKNDDAPVTRQPVFSRPQPAKEVPRAVPEEQEDNRVTKKRHTGEQISAARVAIPPSEEQIDEERVAHQLSVPEGDDDEDITGLWEDIDAEDIDDPLMVAEYAADICLYWKEIENRHLPKPNYMDAHKELTWEHRGALLDWLLQIHTMCPFNAESFFICANLLDRFCSDNFIAPQRLQLLGIACLLIASKFEEILSVSIARLVEWTNKEYTAEEIAKAERYVLEKIQWDLSYSGPMGWLRRASRADGLDPRSRTIAKYLLEVGVFEPRLISIPPSLIAAAALYLARLTVDEEEWHYNLIHYTTYRERELIPVASLMLTYIASVRPPHPNFFKKYASKSFLKASTWMRDWTLDRWPMGSEIDLRDELATIKTEIFEARIARLEEQQDNGWSPT